MKIINAMLGRGQGGIEQAFVDYHDALVLAGHEVHAVIHPDSAARIVLEARKIPFHTLPNWGAWDAIAVLRLEKLLRKVKPDVSIAHGNRAISLLQWAGVKKLIAPLHNYKIKCRGLSAVISPTKDLTRYAQNCGVPAARIFPVPNLVRVPIQAAERQPHTPPVIGSMGRFVPKKGFDIFINALAILKEKNIPFKAVLAGGGEEAAALQSLAALKGLGPQLAFTGWAENKEAFFNQLDMFCLPSHHEPFGIVLLEAMAYKLPVITTNSEGPSEIIEHRINGLITPRGDAQSLADAFAALIKDREHARLLAKHAYDTVRGSYDLPIVSAKLDLALKSIAAL
jgi:glycosyltransferase involved in cell wall biosynthesis